MNKYIVLFLLAVVVLVLIFISIISSGSANPLASQSVEISVTQIPFYYDSDGDAIFTKCGTQHPVGRLMYVDVYFNTTGVMSTTFTVTAYANSTFLWHVTPAQAVRISATKTKVAQYSQKFLNAGSWNLQTRANRAGSQPHNCIFLVG